MSRPPFRIGLGYDIHRLAAGRPCVLGGVTIPSSVGPEGHSDADVLTHALADAILGAMGLPDIGHYFPNTDASCVGMDSQIILTKAVEEAASLGYAISNVDCAIIAETPKIAPHLAAMKARLAVTLRVPEDCVGVKATTNEKLDDIGQRMGIAVHAVAMLARV